MPRRREPTHEHDFTPFGLKYEGGKMRTVSRCTECGQEVGTETPYRTTKAGIEFGDPVRLSADPECPVSIVREVLES